MDGLQTLIWTRTKKPISIAVSGAGSELRGRDGGGDLTNVQHKPIWNCHNESCLYNKYILIKKSKNLYPKKKACRIDKQMKA
jgi:hypothetical protein